MINKFNKYFKYYLISLFFFSIIYLTAKHNVGNDSTISEWLLNYSGGFTKRGLIGQTSIILANLFNSNLRDVILFFQIFLVGIYYILLFLFFKNIPTNKVIILSIFTPIFILYPVAEIEVLARKEIFIFCIFIIYLLLNNKTLKIIYKLTILPIGILIWEPFIFLIPFFIALDIVENNFEKININFIKYLILYIPVITLAFYIALNPMALENHELMKNYLKINFNESCYTACELLASKSTIYDQFEANFRDYSFSVFFRYSLVILVGFGPLILLAKNSVLKNQNLFFFKYFQNLLIPVSLILMPTIFLFAMGSDWGRWVNIGYVFSVIFYFYLMKSDKISLTSNLDEIKILNNRKIFIFIIVVYCFGWNPKTSLKGDIATNPLWKIPYNSSKIIFDFKNFRILEDSPFSRWHKKYVE
jgi:hypothetical protein